MSLNNPITWIQTYVFYRYMDLLESNRDPSRNQETPETETGVTIQSWK